MVQRLLGRPGAGAAGRLDDPDLDPVVPLIRLIGRLVGLISIALEVC